MRRIAAAALAALLALAMLPAALAAPGGTVTYRGQSEGFEFSPGSADAATDLFAAFRDIMPGDARETTVTFKNAASDCDYVELYLRAETKSGEDFLSQLHLRVETGGAAIYDGPAAMALSRVHLGTVRAGDSMALSVELTAPKELGNEFSTRAGEVDWIFSVSAFNAAQLTARKVWGDGSAAHSGEVVRVQLLKNGSADRTAELSARNGWAYTFDGLDADDAWTIEELDVPAGYTASYRTEGGVVTILNAPVCTPDLPVTPQPDLPDPELEPVPDGPDAPEAGAQLTVVKRWDGETAHPDSVNVTLYDGETAVETVRLTAEDGWTHTWTELPAAGDYAVLETDIPRGFYPSYSVEGGDVTITNAASLLDTGRNVDAWYLAGAGAALMLIGALVRRVRRRNA